MENKLEILLGSTKNIASVNVDNFQKIELENKLEPILEYDVNNALSATEIFDAEREANPVYRIYGRTEYLSLLNGLKLNYKILADFFLQQSSNSKNIQNSFKFYLLKAGTGYTSGNSQQWIRYFDVIATPNDFELYNAGYTNNVYGDQVYAFNFNRDFNADTYIDNFGFPATELFLYAQYQATQNGDGIPEVMFSTTWDINGNPTKVPFVPSILNIGDRIYGDLIIYDRLQFLQTQVLPQIFYINTPYDVGVLQWKYEPFMPLRLRYFFDILNNANSGSTSYTQQSSIPFYATPIGGGNFVWRDIIPQGNIDPLTEIGVNYPFINMRRYLFAPIILDVSPNLGDSFTQGVFSEIKYGVPQIMNTNPISDLNNLGKPCI